MISKQEKGKIFAVPLDDRLNEKIELYKLRNRLRSKHETVLNLIKKGLKYD